MDESAEIRERYERRKGSAKNSNYSYFNTANLFMLQRRQRKMLDLLKQHGCEHLSSKTILEIGCGGGEWIRDFIQWGAAPEHIYGIDLLEDRISVARRLNPNVHYAAANAEQLEFPDKHFDIVLLATCLTSILDSGMKRRIALEALRVLRDEGMVLCYDFRYDNPKNPDVKGIKKRELMELFGDSTYDFRLVTLAPPLAQRLAPISWVACEILAGIPFLRTHYFVVIRKGERET
jgi:ubiquinone/menaquinone biosynthesis C-methylase UbiE